MRVCVCVSQVEWIQQQVVKRRIKRDYRPVPPLPLSSTAQSSPAQSNIFYNDAKWSSMWYIVSSSDDHFLLRAPTASDTHSHSRGHTHTSLAIRWSLCSSYPPSVGFATCRLATSIQFVGQRSAGSHIMILITAASSEPRDLCVCVCWPMAGRCCCHH